MRVKPPVGIREVAAHARVSVATVSNVLNRPAIVAEPTRRRVLASIEALGFVRNESARQLRAGRSRMIGLVVLDVANPFFTDVAHGVEDEASKSGLSVILCNSDDRRQKETRYLELLEEHRVQGILITPVTGTDERISRLQRRGTPVVLGELAAAAAVPLSSIHQPRQELGRTAAQLLVAETLGTDAHQHRQVIFEPELVVRPSSQMKARRAQLLARSPSTAEAAG